jgi:hypothetical protein
MAKHNESLKNFVKITKCIDDQDNQSSNKKCNSNNIANINKLDTLLKRQLSISLLSIRSSQDGSARAACLKRANDEDLEEIKEIKEFIKEDSESEKISEQDLYSNNDDTFRCLIANDDPMQLAMLEALFEKQDF